MGNAIPREVQRRHIASQLDMRQDATAAMANRAWDQNRPEWCTSFNPSEIECEEENNGDWYERSSQKASDRCRACRRFPSRALQIWVSERVIEMLMSHQFPNAA